MQINRYAQRIDENQNVIDLSGVRVMGRPVGVKAPRREKARVLDLEPIRA